MIGAGTVLTGSTPVYDLVQRRDHQADGRPSARHSRRRRRRAGRARGHRRARAPSGACRSPRRSSSSTATRAPTRARSSKRGSGRRLDRRSTRALVDIDSTTGREGDGGPLAGATTCAAAAARSTSSRVDDDALQRHRDGRVERRPTVVLLDALRLRAAVLSEPRRRRSALRPRIVRREGHSRGAGGGGRAAARATANARRPAVRRRRRARQRRRAARERRGAGGCRFLVNGEPTDNRLGAGDARHPASEAARRAAAPRTRRFPSSASRRSTS